MLTDERAVTTSGRTDSSGRIILRTGRSVVPLVRLEISIDLGGGNCLEGGLSADELRTLNVDPSIECNARIHVLAEETSSAV